MTGNLEILETDTAESAVSAPLGAVKPDSGGSVFPAHAAGSHEAEAEAGGPDPAESVGEARAVPVRMFDYEYNIMSDKPRLVEILAATIDREARRLKSANASFNRGAFNWPVQVAFKLALDHYNAQKALNDCRQELAECRRELETLAAKVERDAEKLAELIEMGLDAS
jgi:hypothetical protein